MIRIKIDCLRSPILFFFFLLFSLLVFACTDEPEEKPVMGDHEQIVHEDKGHEVRISPPSVAASKTGDIFVAWFAEEKVYVANASEKNKEPVRVNPDGISIAGMHQSPGIAVGPEDEIYISWSSEKPNPEGVSFASDLRLSRSLDGGKTFDTNLRVNEDRPISHSFEGISVAPDGTVFILD